jgi:hypothetical protein
LLGGAGGHEDLAAVAKFDPPLGLELSYVPENGAAVAMGHGYVEADQVVGTAFLQRDLEEPDGFVAVWRMIDLTMGRENQAQELSTQQQVVDN